MTPGPGDLICQKRRRRGWSKPRLCDEIQAWEYQHGNGDVLGLNPNYVREWESGERSVSDYYAPKLSAVLGIPLGTFVDRRTRRGRAAAPSEGRQREPVPAMAVDVARATAEASLDSLGMRGRLLQQWADLAMLGPLGQRLLAKILEPRRTLIMDRRTMVKLLGTGSAAAFWSCCETLAASPRRKRNHRSCSSRRARTSSTRWRCAISTCTTRPRQPS